MSHQPVGQVEVPPDLRKAVECSPDITHQKADEAALRRSEALVRQELAEIEAIYAGAPVGLCVLDKELRYLRINETLAALHGRSMADHLGRTLGEILPPTLVDLIEPILHQALATGVAIKNMEVSRATVKGLPLDRSWLVSYHPLLGEADEVMGINIVVVEVTALKQAELALQRLNTTLEDLVKVRTAELQLANAALHARIAEREESEIALLRSEERYRTLVEMMPDALFVQQHNQVIYANPAFLRLLGATSAEQVLNRAPIDFFHPASHDLIRTRIKHLFAQGGVLPPAELQIVRLDGTVIDVESAASFYQDQEENKIQGILREITERKQAEQQQISFLEQLAGQREQLQILNHKLATAQENERKHLARELHDQVGQNLTALGISLQLLQNQVSNRLPDDGSLLSSFEEAQALIGQVTTTVRTVMSELRPPLLDDWGVLASLRWYAETVARRVNLQIEVYGEEPTPKLAEAVALTLFRIAQEALTNVSKHAQASRVEIHLWADPAQVHLTIDDDGRGFGPTQRTDLGQSYHWGILGMQERATAVAGLVTIESQLGQGTIVHVAIPRNAA